MKRNHTSTRRWAVPTTALAIILIAATSLAAKGPPLPQPDPELGSIAVEITFGRSHAMQAFFVRVKDETDLFEAEYVLPSNYSKKGQVFLLNARPGRYVVVAALAGKARGWAGTFESSAYFDMEMIRQTEVEVVAGRMVFLGEIFARFAERKQMKDADAAQSHFFRLIDPKAAGRGAFSRAYLGNKTANRVVLDRIVKDAACEREFWVSAEERAFRDESAWRHLIEDSVNQLGP